MASVIVVSSEVARGGVGNRVAGFAIERLGLAAVTVPTVLLPHHPGFGPGERIVLEDAAFARFLGDIAAAPSIGGTGAVLSGYLATPAQAAAVADLVRAVKEAAPQALYVCDPVIGDAGRLYRPQPVAEAIRDILLPLADVATPNLFELSWLAGRDLVPQAGHAEIIEAARSLASRATVVTSAPGLMRGAIGALLVQAGETLLAEHREAPLKAHGTGDLFSALLAARLAGGASLAAALEAATASTFALAALTARAGAAELLLSRHQDALVRPGVEVTLRRLGLGARGGAP